MTCQPLAAALSAIVLVTAALPAHAEVRTFLNEDAHLYLNESKATFGDSRFLTGWDSQASLAQLSNSKTNSMVTLGASPLDGVLFVSQGPLRITNNRFLDLVDRAKVAPAFVSKYRADRDWRSSAWLWPLVGSAVVGVGGGATAVGGGVASNGFVLASGLVAAGIGVVGTLVTGALFVQDASSKPTLVLDHTNAYEVYEVIKLYNKKIDGAQ